MDLSFRFDPWIQRVPSSPCDEGRLHRILRRPPGAAGGLREVLERARLTVAGGLEGDRWREDPRATLQDQISLVSLRWLEALTGGEAAHMDLSGDNLQVDLDLSERNLPVGTRLRLGDALIEISPKPHRPCRSFVERFGATAAKRVARAGRLGLRGRGVLAFVVEDGEIAAGDAVRVERRAPER